MLRIAVCAIFLQLVLSAQAPKPGPQVLTFLSKIDDSDQPYGIYVPKTFDSVKRWPLVVSLHGAGSNHRLNLRRVFGKGNLLGETDSEASRYFPPLKDVPFLVATPFARGTMGYQGIAERDVYDVIEDVKKRFPVDEDRVYLTGLSMGGGGTLWLGLTRPDRWAALAAVCPAPPPEARELAGNALALPVHLFQGEFDPLVPASLVREWHKTFLSGGVRSEYIEYPGVRHNSWDRAYRDGAIFDWFAQFRRDRFPARVRFATRDYEHSSAYWVRIDGLTPGTLARVDALFSGPNRIAVTTEAVDGFTLTPAGHPRFKASQPLVVTIDGGEFKIPLRTAAAFTREKGKWRRAPYKIPSGWKRRGLEGPIAQAVASKHVYVYGTADAPAPEELARRQREAEAAANWAPQGSRLLFSPKVIPDRDVKESEISGANLVLFGTAASNSMILKYRASLPMQPNPGAADYGVIFVAPVGERLVVVMSGTSGWNEDTASRRGGWDFLSPRLRAIQSLGDYVVFRGSLDKVIAEGRFTRDWKLPAADATKLRATGAVEVR